MNNSKTTAKVQIFYDSQDPGNTGWAYCVQTSTWTPGGDYPEVEITSYPLPHKRRDCGKATLARSLRREYRKADPVVRALVAQATECMRRDRTMFGDVFRGEATA